MIQLYYDGESIIVGLYVFFKLRGLMAAEFFSLFFFVVLYFGVFFCYIVTKGYYKIYNILTINKIVAVTM